MKEESRAIWLSHDSRVKPYLWEHRIPSLAKMLLSLCLVVGLTLGGWGLGVEQWAKTFTHQSWGLWMIYFAALALGSQLISLPFSLIHFFIERRWGLSKQSLFSWAKDLLKGWAVGIPIGMLALTGAWLCVRTFPHAWWFACAFFLMLFSVLLAQLAPVVFLPLFFKLQPLEKGEMRDRLLKLCERFKIDVKEVYHLGLSEKTEKGNAAFLGLGRTKRIVIGDTLYKRFKLEEVEAVFAHELGHQVHNDLWKGIGVSTLCMFLGFYVGFLVCTHFLYPYASTQPTAPYGFLLFMIALSFVQIPLSAIQAIYSRSREWAADGFAAKRIGLAEPLSDALERLTLQNMSLYHPNALLEFFTHSHPAPGRRIAALRNA